jgi:phosphoribosylamine---glycine ligase
MEKVLIIGKGAREHAIGFSISKDPAVSAVYYAPGNAGTALEYRCQNIEVDGTDMANKKKLARFVEHGSIDTIVVGPEQPLADGIVDFFHSQGFHQILGVTAAASRLESDKFYSYQLMEDRGIPQAKSIFCADYDRAMRAIKALSTDKGVVLKARGLTGGKGVIVCDSRREAEIMLPNFLDEFGQDCLVAERLFGPEYSVFGLSDGNRVVPFEISIQDHKRLLTGDVGPNTGGMGAYGPVPIADASMVRHIADTFMTPVVQEMKEDGREYKGFIYAAIILTDRGPQILEYNCRLGDPETSPLVMMLKDSLYQPISQALSGNLDARSMEIRPGAACCVVMAANGYPDKDVQRYVQGLPINGLGDAMSYRDVKVFHAGTAEELDHIVIHGGRSLDVAAYDPLNLLNAQQKAYATVNMIDRATTEKNNRRVFIHRDDIAAKGIGG